MVNKSKVNPMLNALQSGGASLTRVRLDVPMWSVDHIAPVIGHFEDTMRALKTIKHPILCRRNIRRSRRGRF
jgi:hypothetical protein